MDVIRNRKNGKSKSKQKQIRKLSETNSDEEIRENGITQKTEMENNKRCNNHNNTILVTKNITSAGKNETLNSIENISQGFCDDSEKKKYFQVNFQVDLISVCLLFCGLATRMYRLEEPRNIV